MRKISPQELLTLVNSGADINLPDIPKEATQVQGMDHIAGCLASLAENQMKMVESVDRLTKALLQKDMKTDLKPLLHALAMNRDAGGDDKQEQYDFEVQRLANGRISGITAKIVEH